MNRYSVFKSLEEGLILMKILTSAEIQTHDFAPQILIRKALCFIPSLKSMTFFQTAIFLVVPAWHYPEY